MRIRIAATTFGLIVGATIPLPTPPTEHSNQFVAQNETPELARVPNCESGNSEPARRALTEAILAEAVAARAHSDFEEHWGRPPPAPPGWSGKFEADELEDIAFETGVEAFAVDCEFYPCIVMLFGERSVDAEAEAYFGVPIERQVRSSARGNRDWMSTSFAVHEQDLSDPMAQRWIHARINRQSLLEDRLLRDLDNSTMIEERMPE